MNIKDISPEQLRDFVRQTHENAYVLIDVRQPGEYEQAHIPGARLVPLPELMQSVDRLPHDRDIIFYCRSGARSMTAATMAGGERTGGSRIFNLAGGMLAWDGAVTTDSPKVGVFDRSTTPPEMMETAMNLEKGALRFYTYVTRQHEREEWRHAFDKLAAAEKAHARTVYAFWREYSDPSDIEPFEAVFDSLTGDVMEGGMRLDDAMAQAEAVGDMACIHLVELALRIEYAAYDLYRTMADQSLAPEARKSFLDIAQAEKAHMHVLAKALAGCPA